ncbi:MAG: RDD family protein [Acidobacteriota bacterium]
MSSGPALAFLNAPSTEASSSTTIPPPDALPSEPVPSVAEPVDHPQHSLFLEPSPGPKVVPIPTLTPMRPQSPMDRENFRRNLVRQQQHQPRVARGGGELQQALFQEPEVQQRPEEALYCDALVAQPAQRIVAAAVDTANVVLGMAVFIGIAVLSGVEIPLTRPWLLVPVGVLAAVMVLYRGLWCLANRDTPGMRFAGLRLVDFDGLAPRRKRRVIRQFAGSLSLLSAGVGLAWALVDEEHLTWHDHISKTFPTAV